MNKDVQRVYNMLGSYTQYKCVKDSKKESQIIATLEEFDKKPHEDYSDEIKQKMKEKPLLFEPPHYYTKNFVLIRDQNLSFIKKHQIISNIKKKLAQIYKATGELNKDKLIDMEETKKTMMRGINFSKNQDAEYFINYYENATNSDDREEMASELEKYKELIAPARVVKSEELEEIENFIKETKGPDITDEEMAKAIAIEKCRRVQEQEREEERKNKENKKQQKSRDDDFER